MIDICDMFGPLAGMHVALDRIGAGMPCGVAARFADHDVAEIEAAIGRARMLFPILQTRLVWQRGRPVLQPDDAPARDDGAGPLLDFMIGDDGRTWRYRLVQAGADVWLHAVWGHALADGLSMLRFVQSVAAQLDDTPPSSSERWQPVPSRQQPLLMWLPRFLHQQRRDYVALPARPTACPEVDWLVASPHDRDRVLDEARQVCGGMLGWLAAAVAKAFAEMQDQPAGEVLLNVPVQRSALAETNGFGFGVGSLRFPVRLDPDETMHALAGSIMTRMKALGEAGWDRNLERLLGNKPGRHSRFAAIEAKRALDPNLTVSWKGRHHRLGARDVACFAAAPTLHVSAHADARALSISVTSRQVEGDRRRLLERIAAHLGVHDYATHDLRPSVRADALSGA